MDTTNEQRTVGVDVGGTHLRAAVLDGHGQVLTFTRQKIVARDPQGLLAALDAAVGGCGEGARSLPMAVGIAGPVHTRSGLVAVAPNLGWHDVLFGPLLHRHFGRPVRLVNDLNAITVGEGLYGAGGGSAHVVCVFVGTGVGMGAVCHGHLVEGYDGLATELGHVKVAFGPDARACGCGARGCLEAYTSGRHLPARWAELRAAHPTSQDDGHASSPEAPGGADAIEALAVAGDPVARRLWDEAAVTLGRAVGDAVTLFNPEVLILGGGVLVHAPSLQERLVQSIGQHTSRPAITGLRIVGTALGDQAGTVGAAVLARDLRRS